ncbi:F-box protein [Legionella drancourtii]|uniref:F-box domain-containing protein n=1 Tax=Legionella drancourtii LLAP12 TaxID=658187 RepID=G9EKQ8_9GAMM|nr:hypothetical protein [Legionella drancourtii]EHL32191.1 hypothetical protein LDG_5797 [Legionella drancourtii LLAP12]
MFDLPSELNINIFSFFSNNELLTCSEVNHSGNALAKDMLKKKMASFEIGREALKELSLRHPRNAIIAVDIDAYRPRYLLLNGDLCELAAMRIDVAKHILHNPRLQTTSRIDSNFSTLVCEKYPVLAADIFSSDKIRLPSQDDIVDIIKKHPFLFDQLANIKKFIGLINKSNILIDLSLINQDIALSIVNDTDKFSKFDAYCFIGTVGLAYEDIAMKILNDPKYAALLDDSILLSYGERHVEAAKVIIENRAFTSKLNDKQLEKLQDKVIEHTILLTL